MFTDEVLVFPSCFLTFVPSSKRFFVDSGVLLTSVPFCTPSAKVKGLFLDF